MSKRIPFILVGAFLLTPILVFSSTSLFYMELLGVGGYSSAHNGVVFYSMHQQEAMQKPGLGFDYLKRLQRESGDFGALAIQARLALNHEAKDGLEFQLYNAYLKYKAGFADFWLGHNRLEFGLSSYFDSHALLLPTLAMLGYGFDRDWGAGVEHDFNWGDIGFSLTTGSGMPLHLKGNFLLSGRISRGVLSKDNFNLGLSLALGNTLETMGYHLISSDPRKFEMAAVDFTYLWNNIESRLEVSAGRKAGVDSLALFWRAGAGFLEEGRLKLELQPVYTREGGKGNLLLSAGISFLTSPDLTLRAMILYDRMSDDFRAVLMVYYYRRV